ncbi:hypothetical protein KPL71_016126 [Citrus sinensis]|uniref:Uncharacterized protein n=1 Tax=Citrus sinensis TaxID=2711 RepID=A0ACB8KQB7_CITSI|nr:hypothetical protein KPL71_016126 [Citrus sinensis]
MSFSIFNSLVLFLVLHFSLIEIACDSAEEVHALLKWKTSLQNPSQPPFSSPCAWSGISCNHAGSVVSINLTGSNLKGTLQEFPFLLFPQLAYLDLSVNKLFGTIPTQISHLSKLKHLDFSTNQFSGIIPPQIGILTNLVVLRLSIALSYNRLNGSIPASLGNLSNLVQLSLSNNSLSGQIPPNWGYLTSLVELRLDNNYLTGLIPPSFQNLRKLTVHVQ